MATAPIHRLPGQDRGEHLGYPTSDGRPMAETDRHRKEMTDEIQTLEVFFAGQQVYVTGNILLYYRPGNRRKHISPDVMVVKGIEPRERDSYLLWVEGKGPDVVIEVTSASTKEEDEDDKAEIYREILKVKEYFLFDPRAEYLWPPLQGFRLEEGRYVPIEFVDGRLPSLELGLHLEKRGSTLKFYNPSTGEVLPTPDERRELAEEARSQAEEGHQRAEEARSQAEEARQRAEEARSQAEEGRELAEEARRLAEEARSQAEEGHQRAEEARSQAEEARQLAEEARSQAEKGHAQAEAENERLRREIETLKRRLSGSP
jgi:Uma2 family endonuclease